LPGRTRSTHGRASNDFHVCYRQAAQSRITEQFSTILVKGCQSGRSHDAVIRVYDEAGDVIEMHEEVSSDSPTEELLCKNEAISALPVTDCTKPQVLAFYSGGVRWI
jgi:hypothetical protein